MLRPRILRWHTFRVVIITLLIWVVFGFSVIIYFMDCLNGIGTNCGRRSVNGKSVNGNNNHPDISNLFETINRDNLIATDAHSDEHSAHLLPHYRSENLKLWHFPVLLKTNPLSWAGENGTAVIIGKDEEKLQNETFKLNHFNLLVSDRIALNRSLPDVRMEWCKTKKYPRMLPSTSIVIVFHNEALSTLLRTIHSVIRMSPRELIEEIILVDDASERDFLGKKLEDDVSKLPVPVKVLRAGNRSGLIRARLIGTAQTKGQVITFLDSHCECTIGWLQPLLARIVEDRTRVVCPIIDVLSDKTFAYIPVTDMNYGGFNWKLNFRWYRVPQREVDRRNGDRSLPMRTPIMAGGLFSIDRQFFQSIGTYDDGMEIWGGENIELSLRIWMCGGTLEIVTCSHVGHVFRHSSPHTFPGGTTKILNHNYARLAEVWLDHWKGFYYAINPVAKAANKGDLSLRKKLRKHLKCKDFRWYLENVYPESQMPRDYYSLGEIRNINDNKCLDTFGRKSGENVAVIKCHGKSGNQLFAYTKRKQIVSDDNCLDASSAKSPVKLIRCHEKSANQLWDYNNDTNQIIHRRTGTCLDRPEKNDMTLPVLIQCDESKMSQKWIMNSDFKWQVSNRESNKTIDNPIVDTS